MLIVMSLGVQKRWKWSDGAVALTDVGHVQAFFAFRPWDLACGKPHPSRHHGDIGKAVGIVVADGFAVSDAKVQPTDKDRPKRVDFVGRGGAP